MTQDKPLSKNNEFNPQREYPGSYGRALVWCSSCETNHRLPVADECWLYLRPDRPNGEQREET